MNQPYPLTKEQVRLLLLYDFRMEKKAANSIADINTAFGPDTVSKSTAYDWYSRFQKGNESLEDQPRTGRPSEFDNSALQEALEANNRQTSRELADLLGVSHTTILHHLAELGKKAKLGIHDMFSKMKIKLPLCILRKNPKEKQLKKAFPLPPPSPAPALLDPRLPLTLRQRISIMESWKGISCDMTPIGISMLVKLFENHCDLLNLFEKFQGLEVQDGQAERMELKDHARNAIATLDNGIKSLDNLDVYFKYLHAVGETHTKIPGFEKENFKKIKGPFLRAVRETLQERYTPNIESIYRVAIDFLIQTLIDGYENALKRQ
ncbi:unnamed protein product [Darwinula stevensoni]|uniref:Globin domain-containing protein n=1 Tax=Darwinula stevensoni TaxID=69355 RepID=A0A7R9A078_9CRUS|nr:unnamed protein product [Darwinula stevensoni]CAG0885047.1 unnamed protein product [Darwinula stevensoni]